ncbi:MAG: hypothetical protein K5930_00980 [Treponemataceae bacterium]|nr:hypothetical protein [Treponemataceae bacterium]
MEKRIPIITILFLLSAFIFAAPEDISFIRIKIWAPYDAVPSLDNSSSYNKDDPFKHASDLLTDTGKFILNAMVYGWNFSITPKDNSRGVKEYAEFLPQKGIDSDFSSIKWTNTVFEQDRITCWLEFDRSPLMMHAKSWWNTINIPRIHGKGEYPYSGDFEAIKEVFFDAAKKAVLSYAKKTEKNIPKEITGLLLLKTDTPKLRIDSGKYVADLDFFLYVDKIVRYSQ